MCLQQDTLIGSASCQWFLSVFEKLCPKPDSRGRPGNRPGIQLFLCKFTRETSSSGKSDSGMFFVAWTWFRPDHRLLVTYSVVSAPARLRRGDCRFTQNEIAWRHYIASDRLAALDCTGRREWSYSALNNNARAEARARW